MNDWRRKIDGSIRRLTLTPALKGNGDRAPRGSGVRARFVAAAGAALRVLGIGASGGREDPEGRIHILMKAGAEAGLFDEAEHEMVRRVFRLGRQRAGVLMTPMKEVVWLDVSE